ncbi:hypothetical protein TWF481_002180 [Arthrobotrys musiformis]|uniref:Uncharacterized protein n=1 Tax=Arthrobotrys musiformis TaxID=47236 RepID=A0AAV9VSG0_9PEZI
MPRAAQLLVSRTAKPDIPAHWSLYIPYSLSSPLTSSQETGKLIHVVGSPLHGFTLEFKAPYIPSEDSIKRVPFPLYIIRDEHVKDTEYYITNDGSKKTVVLGTDLEGYEDDLERIAMNVEAPGRMKGWNPLVPAKVGDKNCQWWMRNYIDALVSEGIIGEDVYSNLAKIPETWGQFQETA